VSLCWKFPAAIHSLIRSTKHPHGSGKAAWGWGKQTIKDTCENLLFPYGDVEEISSFFGWCVYYVFFKREETKCAEVENGKAQSRGSFWCFVLHFFFLSFSSTIFKHSFGIAVPREQQGWEVKAKSESGFFSSRSIYSSSNTDHSNQSFSRMFQVREGNEGERWDASLIIKQQLAPRKISRWEKNPKSGSLSRTGIQSAARMKWQQRERKWAFRRWPLRGTDVEGNGKKDSGV
jgi:hypothetical protein